MTRSQLAQFKVGRNVRLLAAANEAMRHPAQVVMPEGAEPLVPGSDGLVRFAIRVTGHLFRLVSVEVRDAAWRSSDETEDLRAVATDLRRSILERDWVALERILASISSGLVVESIELADVDTARRVRITSAGSIETQVPSAEEDSLLIERLLAAANEGA